MRKVTQASTFLFVFVLILNACTVLTTPGTPAGRPPTPSKGDSSTTTQGPVVTIRFGCPSQDRAEFVTLAAEFHAQNPSINVEVVSIEDVATDWQTAYFQLMSAVDTAYYRVTDAAITQGLLRDLTPFVEADNVFAPEDFFPGTLAAFKWHNGAWALPSSVSMSFLFYDKSIFDTSGVSYPTLDWDPDDFLDIAQRLTKRQGTDVLQYGFVDIAGVAGDAFILSSVKNRSLLDGQTPLTAPEVVGAVRWYTDLALRYQAMPKSPRTGNWAQQAQDLVVSGRAAMWSDDLMHYWRYRDDLSRDVGFTSFPTPTGPVTRASMYGYIMSAGTEHPQESWRWLSFLTRQRLLGTRSAFGDCLPARRSVAEQSGYWDRFDKKTIDTVRYAAEHLCFSPLVGARQLNVAVAAVFDGKPVDVALTTAQETLEQQLAEAAQSTPVAVVVSTPQPTDAGGVTTVTFAPPPFASVEIYRTLADLFNQAHPNLQVQLVAPNEADQADCFAGTRSVDDQNVRTDLLNLQPFLDADPSFPLDDFYPRFLEAFRFQGDLWGLPTQAQVRAVFYNPQLFDAAGLPHPVPGWTLDDFLDRAVALTKGEGAEKQYGFLPLNGDTSDLLTFLTLQGAAPWDEQGKPRFDASDVVVAMRWYADLALKYGVTPTFPGDLPDGNSATQETRNALVRQGRVAMWTDFTGVDRSDIWPTDIQVGSVPLPTRAQGQSGASEFLYEGLFIAADAPNPQACWEWLKFASAHAEFLTNLPARRSILESAAFAQQIGAEAIGTYQASLEYAEVRMPATPEVTVQLHWLYQALADVLQGASPEIALVRAQQQAEK